MEVDQKKLELLDCNHSHNILRDLMLRDFGYFGYKTNTHNLQSVAETNLIAKKHKELKYDLPGVPKATFLMAFSPDGTKVASAHGNHNVYISEVATGKNIKILSGHPRSPWCITFHPSSNQILASGCLGGQVRVWDLRNGCTVWNAESRTVIASLAFHPSGKSLVIATNNAIYFLDWRRSESLAVISTKDENEKVRYVAFDHSGRKLITGIGNIPYRQESTQLSGLHRPNCVRNVEMIHRNEIPNHYPERTIQNETIHSSRTNATESSYSTQSNLLDSVTIHNFDSIVLEYTGNSRSRIRRGNSGANFQIDDDLLLLPGRVSFIMSYFPEITSYRVQAWDFTNEEMPDITNYSKNIVIRQCRIQTDASIDISADGKLLASCSVGAVGIYSLQWETLGQRIYWTKITHGVVSVSISPTQEHLLVGLARTCSHSGYTMASIYKLMNKMAKSNDNERDLYLCFKNKHKSMLFVRSLLQSNQSTAGHISINCIKWAPHPGQGLVYATTNGQLVIVH